MRSTSEDALRGAQSLSRFGIDGVAVFRDARQIAKGIEQTGRRDMRGGPPDAAT